MLCGKMIQTVRAFQFMKCVNVIKMSGGQFLSLPSELLQCYSIDLLLNGQWNRPIPLAVYSHYRHFCSSNLKAFYII